MKRLPLFIILTLFGGLILASFNVAAQTGKNAKEDAVFELQNVSLYVNRAPVAEGVGTCGGTVVWFYLRDKGQFVFSSNPHDGFDFQNVGAVKGNLISFWYKDDLYEVTSTSQIIKDGGESDLWLLHDSSYRPKGCDNVCFGSASPFEYFIKSR